MNSFWQEREAQIVQSILDTKAGFCWMDEAIVDELGRGQGIEEARWKEAVGSGCKASKHFAIVLNMLLWPYRSKNLSKVFKQER